MTYAPSEPEEPIYLLPIIQQAEADQAVREFWAPSSPSPVKLGGNIPLADILDLPVTDTPVVWSSSNPAVATVNPVTGEVITTGYGTVTITASSNGAILAAKTLTVEGGSNRPNAAGTVQILAGEYFNLMAALGFAANGETFTWTVEPESVAVSVPFSDLNTAAKLVAVSEGTATVTIVNNVTGEVYTVQIHVKLLDETNEQLMRDIRLNVFGTLDIRTDTVAILSLRLADYIDPANLEWDSSNLDVAAVEPMPDENDPLYLAMSLMDVGEHSMMIKGLSRGETIITVRDSVSGESTEIKIVIVE
ncbi:hypothetical protein FACS1894184_19580 [Clostridia bacterium]|nr:hypothetical protein FACS1894184_19580 [Clostridia bacterium]